MELINITSENIDWEHICCAISDKKGESRVSSKKAWLRERFQDGLIFKRLDARGKVFIEYIPAEKAWLPITAPGYMHINCFWVSGQFQGQGHASRLLDACINDAKERGMCGLTIVSSVKKQSFLSDGAYMRSKGFLEADTAAPYFVLYYLPFSDSAPVPKFRDCAKSGLIEEQGMVLYYTNQCPHTDMYVPLIAAMAESRGTRISVHKITTTEEAQNAPTPFTTYSFYHNGKFVTNEILGEKKFQKLLEEYGY